MSEAEHPAQRAAACRPDTLEAAVSRRSFLFGAGATLVWIQLPGCRLTAEVAHYPRRAIARLSELEAGKAVGFRYPADVPAAQAYLLKLGQPAGGGVGPDRDIVAFNAYCTHQGGPLTGMFRANPPIAGPCPLHWTTFDLTRHGMVVSGHATAGLPQILLETEGDEILAIGVQGLVYGEFDSRALLSRT